MHFILLQSRSRCYGNCCYNDRYYRDKDQSVTKSVTHVVSIWKERRVFEDETISKFNTILSEGLFLLLLHPYSLSLLSGSGHYKRSKSESDALATTSTRRGSSEDSSSVGVVIDTEPTPPPQEEPPNDREPPQVINAFTSRGGSSVAGGAYIVHSLFTGGSHLVQYL